MDRDVADLIEHRKIPVYVVEEDLAERGISSDELVSGVELLSRRALPGLFAEYEIVSHW
jgi:sulfur relay (sulfurtransferase) DsrF/TusC family protein